MSIHDTITIAEIRVRRHLGLPDDRGFHCTIINTGILFFRDNVLYTWDEKIQDLTYDEVKELTQGLLLGDF